MQTNFSAKKEFNIYKFPCEGIFNEYFSVQTQFLKYEYEVNDHTSITAGLRIYVTLEFIG
jgi:hypothetical protein